MAKNVFRPYEFKNTLADIVSIKAPAQFTPAEVEVLEEADEYHGPTADDLRREADAFKEQWASERGRMIQEAELQKLEILKEAETAAFELIKKEKEDALQLRIEAEKTAQSLIDDGRRIAEQSEAEARARIADLEEAARKKAAAEGYQQGYTEGASEVARLVERIHVIIEKLIEKRQEIIEGTETQLVSLVILIAKKVVKVISENQRNVVINNVLQALRKLKTRGDVVVRVNLEDLKVTTEHIKEFLSMVENVKSITVMEDTSVDQGGAVIETDFGEIDAKIASQFAEIEEKILEMAPIRAKTDAKPTGQNG
ncbi:MAG: flagellar assembly protein FliH [Spirochaetales bacterium]